MSSRGPFRPQGSCDSATAKRWVLRSCPWEGRTGWRHWNERQPWRSHL